MPPQALSSHAVRLREIRQKLVVINLSRTGIRVWVTGSLSLGIVSAIDLYMLRVGIDPISNQVWGECTKRRPRPLNSRDFLTGLYGS